MGAGGGGGSGGGEQGAADLGELEDGGDGGAECVCGEWEVLFFFVFFCFFEKGKGGAAFELEVLNVLHLANAFSPPNLGLQLPRRLAIAHLYHATGGRRPPDPIWIRGWVRAECGASGADDILLEQ